MRTNTAIAYPSPVTHEGGPADRISPYQELRRSVLTCLLWEDTFYESGSEVAKRISGLCEKVEPEKIAMLAIEARENMKLRHVSLFLAVQLSKRKGCGSLVSHVLETVIQRADEMSKVLAMYWKDKPTKDGRRTGGAVSHRGIKRGIAAAFQKFDEYRLAKYDRANAVKLRDALFLSHAKPKDDAQADLWKRLIAGTLETPDTWETKLSGGADKKETFERLLQEKKLGGMAVLRNLRNMIDSGVDENLIRERLEIGIERALPFRFITAARYAPRLESSIETAMLKAIDGMPRLTGSTFLMIDVSGSMEGKISAKSETTRMDCACGLAVLARELCERSVIGTFSNSFVEVPARRGFALRDAINKSQEHGGTELGNSLRQAFSKIPKMDRLIVITDEQSADRVQLLGDSNAYCINVATYKNGVSYSGGWNHIDGWSEHCLDYIREIENESARQSD